MKSNAAPSTKRLLKAGSFEPVIIIDHRDSFTYNILHLVRSAGADAVVLPHSEAPPKRCRSGRAVILGPGPFGPEAVPETSSLLRFLGSDIPILGICLGMQIIAAREGGVLRRAARTAHGILSSIDHRGRGLFEGISRPARFVRYHSLALGEPAPASLCILARDDDGDIAAFAHRAAPRWGVQFHPESILSEQGELLLRNFLRLADGARREGGARPHD